MHGAQQEEPSKFGRIFATKITWKAIMTKLLLLLLHHQISQQQWRRKYFAGIAIRSSVVTKPWVDIIILTRRKEQQKYIARLLLVTKHMVYGFCGKTLGVSPLSMTRFKPSIIVGLIWQWDYMTIIMLHGQGTRFWILLNPPCINSWLKGVDLTNTTNYISLWVLL